MESRRNGTAPLRACGRAGGAKRTVAGSGVGCAGAARRGPVSAAGAGVAVHEPTGVVGLLAGEDRSAYDAGGDGPGCHVHEHAVTGAGLVDEAGEDWDGTPGGRARAALARLAAGPGDSPLAAALAQLTDAVEALADVAPTAEPVEDVGDALLGLVRLRHRLDGALLSNL